MAKTDIFNPHRGYDPSLGFNANWSYGAPRKIGANMQTQRPRFGTWATRVVGGAGYSFDLTFVDRSLQQVEYIRRSYEQFKRGYFTLIDHDGGGREHTGRFTNYSDNSDSTQTANGKYTVHVLFEEIPGCPMRNYPCAWSQSSHYEYVVDDFGYTTAGTLGSAWSIRKVGPGLHIYTPGDALPLPSESELWDPAAAAGDFAQMEYVGWGFRMTFPISSSLGVLNLFVDGVELVTELDLLSGDCTSSTGVEFVGDGSNGEIGIVKLDLPLNRHRVKVVATGAKNSASSDTAIVFPAIERFPGFLSQWTQAVTSPPLTQIAQPAPINVFNSRRSG